MNQFPYDFVKFLGQGQFGKVSLVKEKATGQQYAMKEINKDSIAGDPVAEKNLLNEINIMEKIKSENVVKIKEVLASPKKYYLILEYCQDGDLEQFHKKKENLKQEEVLEILQQIFCGLQALHEVKVVHKDLKQANIFYHQGVFKLGDFGFARTFTNAEMILASSVQGSPAFMPPELIKQTGYYSSKVDMWSVGVIAFYLLFNAYPFDFTPEHISIPLFKFKVGQMPNCNFAQAIKDVEQYLNEKIQNKILHPYWKDFFMGIFTIDPLDRISWNNLYRLPLFNEFVAYSQDVTASMKFDNQKQRFQKTMQSSRSFYDNLDQKEKIKLEDAHKKNQMKQENPDIQLWLNYKKQYDQYIDQFTFLQETIQHMEEIKNISEKAFSNSAIFSLSFYLFLKMKSIYEQIHANENIFSIPELKFENFLKSEYYTKLKAKTKQAFESHQELKNKIAQYTKTAFPEAQWKSVNELSNPDHFQEAFKLSLLNYKLRLLTLSKQENAIDKKRKLLILGFESYICVSITGFNYQEEIDAKMKDFNFQNIPQQEKTLENLK